MLPPASSSTGRPPPHVVSVHSQSATTIEVVVTNAHLEIIERHGLTRRGHTWTARFAVANEAMAYGLSVDGGPLLLDPRAEHVIECAGRPLGLFVPPSAPASPGPRHPLHELVIYELHVGNFTGDANGQGGYLSAIERLDHLVDLGITAVEFMPLHHFDRFDNVWGYMSLSYLAPHSHYATRPDQAATELTALVDACHERGLEVIVDVVFNHTAEAAPGERDTTSLRGIDQQSYYLHDANGRSVNWSGCGNVLRTGGAPARHLVLDSVRHWITRYGVDGFRYDLASLLCRNDVGELDVDNCVLVDELSALGRQHNVRMIAEAWDLTVNLVGHWPSGEWGQWNGFARDTYRSFLRGDDSTVAGMIDVISGSPSMFDRPGGSPHQSVNFITAHDGFTLYDLFSYTAKRNGPNGHNNRDGTDDNRSSNCGFEGDRSAEGQDVPDEIVALRHRKIRLAAALMMLSAGTPMMTMGDELARSQRGNNNPYNLFDESTFVDWSMAHTNGDLVDWWRALIEFRRQHPSIGRPQFWGDDVTFFGVNGPPDINPWSHSLAWWLRGESGDDIYVCVNGWSDALTFSLPTSNGWRVALDTSFACVADMSHPVVRGSVATGAHCVQVLVPEHR
jgi:isoamylase